MNFVAMIIDPTQSLIVVVNSYRTAVGHCRAKAAACATSAVSAATATTAAAAAAAATVAAAVSAATAAAANAPIVTAIAAPVQQKRDRSWWRNRVLGDGIGITPTSRW
jgi:hypothetical protein